MKTIFSLSLLSLLFSCALMKPSERTLASLDYGEAPTNYVALFKQGMKMRLKDPSSLQTLDIKPPKKMWSRDLNGVHNYWVICGLFNAKNSFGGYTGFQPGGVWYKNDRVGFLNLINGEMPGITAEFSRPCG